MPEEAARKINALNELDIQTTLKLLRKALVEATREPEFFGEVGVVVKFQAGRTWDVRVTTTAAYRPTQRIADRAA